MDDFSEKGQQINPGSLTAFGINIWSRYGKAQELIEMMEFCKLITEERLTGFVKEIFYDTKANLCTIELESGIDESDSPSIALLACAEKTISQFEWFGIIHHGRELLEYEK